MSGQSKSWGKGVVSGSKFQVPRSKWYKDEKDDNAWIQNKYAERIPFGWGSSRFQVSCSMNRRLNYEKHDIASIF